MSHEESTTHVDKNVETELLEIAEKYKSNVQAQQEKLHEMANRTREMTPFRRLFAALFPHLEEERRVRG